MELKKNKKESIYKLREKFELLTRHNTSNNKKLKIRYKYILL